MCYEYKLIIYFILFMNIIISHIDDEIRRNVINNFVNKSNGLVSNFCVGRKIVNSHYEKTRFCQQSTLYLASLYLI